MATEKGERSAAAEGQAKGGAGTAGAKEGDPDADDPPSGQETESRWVGEARPRGAGLAAWESARAGLSSHAEDVPAEESRRLLLSPHGSPHPPPGPATPP